MTSSSFLATEDHDLASQIAMKLAETRRFNLQRLAVDVHEGEVTLRGSVASFYEKQIAIETCRLRDGLCRVIDAVEVVN
jgi:osmotically-inducible protein OsmY